jgi:F0F1-type ATP synthase assembly protein I
VNIATMTLQQEGEAVKIITTLVAIAIAKK